jgi:quercetin dioxygenase-like cupin family protein
MTMRTSLFLRLASFSLLSVLSVLAGCASGVGQGVVGQQAIVVTKLVQSTNSWDGKRLPAYPVTQPEITILRISIAPGARLPLHFHPVINAGVLLTGQLKIETVNGAVLQLRAGDPIIEIVNMAHYGINDGTVPAEIIVVYAGTVDQAVTVIQNP